MTDRWTDDEYWMYASGRVSGTGSISCRGITEEDAQEALERRRPIGFGVNWHDTVVAIEQTKNAILQERREWLDHSLWQGSASPEWGEAAWTARDLT